MLPVIGIDPGITGAIAVRGDDPDEVDVFDMPTLTEGKHQRINAVELANLIRSLRLEHNIAEARIEKVNAMPPAKGKAGGKPRNPGTQSSFNFGRGVGVIDGIMGAFQLPTIHVTPQQWKKPAGLIGKVKDEARTRALELYPHLELHRKKDVGRADAILIAHYGGPG